ncbi:MAG: glucose-6-phosphate isomerase [Acidimicrobiaceae bacterium]|nr:glucose-6-phosphate isomerase [Acidimicrobiaceae bacterium]|tara:strand:- start:465 stop:2096 length:1632 start_codon:yes stop_codon:yes gene_type:complete
MVDVNPSLDDGLPIDGPVHSASAWAGLRDRVVEGTPSLRALLNNDPDRGKQLGIKCVDILVDLSRQHLTDEVLGHLQDLARQRRVVETLGRVLAGDTVNGSENQAASHGALRDRTGKPSGSDIEAARRTFDRMTDLATAIRDGKATGATGHRITALVHLGIGGSHLGPALAVDALKHHTHPDVTIRFSSAIDTDDLDEALSGLDPQSTLVVVCSKSFTTIETLKALDAALDWLTADLGDVAIDHVIAVTTAVRQAQDRGIQDDHILKVPVSVGGRFSIGSAVGLSVMVAIGPQAFSEMLAGMSAVDAQSATQPVEENAAILLALVDVWNRCHLGRGSMAVVPYAHRLRLFVSWLQQLSMESLGKGVCQNGDDPGTPTGPVVWGATGTDAQHAFFQLLHQGTDVVPVDFIGLLQMSTSRVDDAGVRTSANLLLTNLVAHADALAFGRNAEEVRSDGVDEALVAHRTFPGDRPSTTVLLPELTPTTLGQLISLYENRTVAFAALLGINPFDQWGVELGKRTARELADESMPEHGLLRRVRSLEDE